MYPNILAECTRHNLTMQDLADKFEVSQKTVSNWLHGRTAIPGKALKAMADMWGVTMEYLFYETNQAKTG